MNSPSSWTRVEAELEALERVMDQNRSAQRRTSRTALFVTLTLCMTIVTFLTVNYFTLSASWAKENFAESLQKEIVELSPVLTEQVNLLAQELVPIYAQEARKQLGTLGPQITQRAQEEFDLFGVELLDTVKTRMEDKRALILGNVRAELVRGYPALADPAIMSEIQARFEDTTEQAIMDAISKFERRFSRDMEDVRGSLLKLDISDSDESTVDLQKRFLRLWIQVLEQEIMDL